MESSLSECFSGDFSCAVCRDIFKHPVLLLCSHSFCKACLHEWWTHKEMKECPVCKNISSMDEPPCNLALKNLCETFIQEKRRKMDPKEAAEESLELLQEKLKIFTKVKTNCDQTAEHIKVQSQNTERQIKEQFKELHQFLQEEEEARIAALREDESNKSQIMKEKIDSLNREISTLSNTIRAIEEELKAECITQIYKNIVERVQFTLQDPQLVSGALIDEVKHLGNLTFRVWDKMKEIVSYTPVILDPNTAHPRLILSGDLTSVRRGEEQQLPDNPERFDLYCRVLSSAGFNSGSHSWDVEVGDNSHWTVGVLAESMQRKGKRVGQCWKISLYDGKYAAHSKPAGSITGVLVKQKPRRIRVQLDWSRGKLSFSDPDTNTLLHTFQHFFTDTLFPYVHNGDDTLPLKMLPRKMSVIKEEDDHTRVSARHSSGRPPCLQLIRPFRP